ncbi:MAG: hypothetical protein ACM3N5_01950 [Candidatus Eiseniibacteriota bacterium]
MSGRRIDWAAVALYTVLGVAGAGFIGWVLWRLAVAVDWMASALLGCVIAFGLLMVSFDLRGGRGEPVTETPASETGDAAGAAAKPPRRGRPRKAKPVEPPPAPPPAGAAPGRGPRNRAGRAPIVEPPQKPRPRNRS